MISVEPHSYFYSELAWHELDGFYLVRALHDAFGQAEAYAEVLEVGRRRHHDSMGRSIVAQGNRRLFGD